MKVERAALMWTEGETARMLRSSQLVRNDLVRIVESEEAFWEHLPPRRNMMLYVVDTAVSAKASPGLIAALTARPGTWPPLIAVSEDRDVLHAVEFMPNSRLLVNPATLVEKLERAVSYWFDLNEPLDLY